MNYEQIFNEPLGKMQQLGHSGMEATTDKHNAALPDASQATTEHMSDGDAFGTQQDMLPHMGESLEQHLNCSLKQSPSTGALLVPNEHVSPELKRDAHSDMGDEDHQVGQWRLGAYSSSKSGLSNSDDKKMSQWSKQLIELNMRTYKEGAENQAKQSALGLRLLSPSNCSHGAADDSNLLKRAHGSPRTPEGPLSSAALRKQEMCGNPEPTMSEGIMHQE